MKKFIYLFIAITIIASSCTEKNPREIKLEKIKDSLEEVNSMRDATINEYMAAMNDIEDNLSRIKEKENIVTVTTTQDQEITSDQKDKINEDINFIYDLLKQNKQKLQDLQKKLSSSDIKIAELNKMINRLNQKLSDKGIEVELLKEKLADMNIEIEILSKNIDSLSLDNARKDDIIDEKTDELNVAYYVFGTKKELLEHEVITKEGGFVGLGRILKLQKDFNKDYFTKIDIRNFKEVILNFKSAELITSHPSSSYKFVGDDHIEKMIITNPDEFWSTSKYLVIKVE